VGKLDTNLRIMSMVGRLGYRLDRRHRRRILTNLACAFPSLPPDQREALAIRSLEHFMKLVAEMAVTPRIMHGDTWASHVGFRDMGGTLEHLNAGRPAIVLTGHVGNWEMLGYTNALMGYPVDALARPIDNPLVNRWLLGIREQRGLRIITKFDATDRMVEVLQSGGSLGFVADQNAGRKGLFVPFFNRLASTYKSIGLLAISQNVPIVCGYAGRVGRNFKYEISTVDIIHPHEWESQPDPLFYITARYTHAIETMVRRDPAQYLWMHRRWKSRPRWEKEGKPMPASFEAKLRTLPWIDDRAIELLKIPSPPAD
jgi:KDO2-lipid IV(A) lauroyltransferase